MSSLLPVAVYGLKVPAGDVMVPALIDFPATVSDPILESSVRVCYCASNNPAFTNLHDLVPAHNGCD